jgi:hypothetical protein
MSEFLLPVLAILGLLAGVKSRALPSSGLVALVIQAFPLTGYYLFFTHCHT